MDIKALTFDTGGTLLDWHGGLVAEFERVAARNNWGQIPISSRRDAPASRPVHGPTKLESDPNYFDWHAVVNDWRRRAMKAIVGQVEPSFNMDDVHRRTLDKTAEHFGLGVLSADERDDLWRTWHALDAWPDFPAAAATLRKAFPVVSFTMLPTSLVVDVSRKNGLVWDAIISCEMIGVYKPDPRAYATAAKWLNLEPAQILMVACHNFDLNAAHKAGFRTAFIRRPDEWGPEGPPEPNPNMRYDFVEDGFDGLVRSLGA